jgi:hypothetical protein
LSPLPCTLMQRRSMPTRPAISFGHIECCQGRKETVSYIWKTIGSCGWKVGFAWNRELHVGAAIGTA